MRLAFHTPFKPLDHPRLSGDVTIARDLLDFFAARGHSAQVMPGPETSWLYWRPWRWPALAGAMAATALRLGASAPDASPTYHSLYQAPDLLGPLARRLGTPYFLFAGAYATRRRKHWRTWPGFQLNRAALLAADHVFANKRADLDNCLRLLPHERISYIRPGIRAEWFPFDGLARAELRQAWAIADEPVVLAVAMFRPGVKVEGLEWTIRACGRLAQRGLGFLLVLAGDGPARADLQALADREAPGLVRFLGRVDRRELRRAYSAADLFVFPGIREGLGMVYLEAQCCGLPVVAWDHDGAPEVVAHGETGLITPSYDMEAFVAAIERLLLDPTLRQDMGRAAMARVRRLHDLFSNYVQVEQTILDRCDALARRGVRRRDR